MIVSEHEIELVLSTRRLRRRMMRLPNGKACPVNVGQPYRLQTRAFTRSKATITVIGAWCEPLEEITLTDARREGYRSIEAALGAWSDTHGVIVPGQRVWVIPFLRGDESAFFAVDKPVYLTRRARDGSVRSDYTERPEQAVMEHGVAAEVAVVPGAGERARVAALAQRQKPIEASLNRVAVELDTLAGAMLTMKAKNRARMIAAQIERLRTELPLDPSATLRAGRP